MEDWLFSVSGGLAVADTVSSTTNYLTGGAVAFTTSHRNTKKTFTGYNIGVQIEKLINDWVSVGIGYTFADFGTTRVTQTPNVSFVSNPIVTPIKLQNHIVTIRASVNLP